jgi:hypothetical protein
MRPLVRALGQSMLHRVVMDVIQVMIKIILVANQVFPETALPDPAISLPRAGLGAGPLAPAIGQICTGEGRFDEGDAGGEIGILFRQRQDQMKVVVEEDDGIKGKWAGLAAGVDGLTKQGAGGGLGEDRSTVMSDEGEEERPARPKCTTIVGHDGNIPQQAKRRNHRAFEWMRVALMHRAGFIPPGRRRNIGGLKPALQGICERVGRDLSRRSGDASAV